MTSFLKWIRSKNYILQDPKVNTSIIMVTLFLIDGIGSCKLCPLYFKKLHSKNFKIRVYNPLPFKTNNSFLHGWRNLLLPLLRGAFWVNKRNHRKTYIIDKKIAYVGSINITKLHSFRLTGERYWYKATRWKGCYSRLFFLSCLVWPSYSK